ncbi:hypothetical protein SDC9_176601 [bioreactor metagenome]|uniref:Uncharacterized protein n=1 Tax=bioreactor metagenome TaxID=1076179 RepID=A0A645GS96_9ZZZZ
MERRNEFSVIFDHGTPELRIFSDRTPAVIPCEHHLFRAGTLFLRDLLLRREIFRKTVPYPGYQKAGLRIAGFRLGGFQKLFSFRDFAFSFQIKGNELGPAHPIGRV